MKIKFTSLLCLILSNILIAQIKDYNYERVIGEIKEEQWAKIVLPDALFEKIDPDFSDLRIYGFNGTDTMEAPYLLTFSKGEQIQKEAAFHLLNESKNQKGYFYTFETAADTNVNQLKLSFRQQNFDWHLTLEGSQDQQEWFSLAENYRILAIKNETTDFNYTTVHFPSAGYRYYRISINSDKKPELLNARIALNENKNSILKTFPIVLKTLKEEKSSKQTIVTCQLSHSVPVAAIKFIVKNKFDYYRAITIDYLTDSIKTPQGWIYNYATLTSGTLNSLSTNDFVFNTTLLKQLRISIYNGDNQPLQIDSIQVQGYFYELTTHFTQAATYYLMYGNSKATHPDYDLYHFKNKIPKTIASIIPGEEQVIKKETSQQVHPLFENKQWLWILILIIISVLGVFSYRMINAKKNE